MAILISFKVGFGELKHRIKVIVFYAFLGLAYIALITPPYRTAIVCYYSLLVVDLLVLNTLTPYSGAIYTILDLGESYQGMALKI